MWKNNLLSLNLKSQNPIKASTFEKKNSYLDWIYISNLDTGAFYQVVIAAWEGIQNKYLLLLKPIYQSLDKHAKIN